MKRNIIKEEKGSVATLVIFTIVMFIVILMGVYLSITTLQKSQLKSDMRISDLYGGQVERIEEIYEEEVPYSTKYEYTGNVQVFTVPYTGTYKIECYGAQGGDIDTFKGGKGAYTKGEINLKKGEKLYIYVGGQGTNTDIGGYNGGSSLTSGQKAYGSSGGGATDIRLIGGTWDNSEGLKKRIMVAAGGGGANNRNRGDTAHMYGAGDGGAGGELIGLSGTSVNYAASGNIPTYDSHDIGTGGTQTQGGSWKSYRADGTLKGSSITGKFGDANAPEAGVQSGGGSGYYGGGLSGHGGAGGGSSFISGHTGCNAINSNGTHTGQPNHFSGYVFSETQMIAGNKQMPVKTGTGTMLGNSGNGFVRITKI